MCWCLCLCLWGWDAGHSLILIGVCMWWTRGHQPHKPRYLFLYRIVETNLNRTTGYPPSLFKVWVLILLNNNRWTNISLPSRKIRFRPDADQWQRAANDAREGNSIRRNLALGIHFPNSFHKWKALATGKGERLPRDRSVEEYIAEDYGE